jgi:competence protein ComEA
MARWLDQDFLWTRPQRRALLLLLAIFTLVLAVRYARNRAYIPSPQPANGLRAAELATQLDPNVASWQELAAIPTVGEKRAKAIVEVRERLASQHPDQPPFARIEDLMRVKGIGKATAENLKPYLMFPSARPPATRR